MRSDPFSLGARMKCGQFYYIYLRAPHTHNKKYTHFYYNKKLKLQSATKLNSIEYIQASRAQENRHFDKKAKIMISVPIREMQLEVSLRSKTPRQDKCSFLVVSTSFFLVLTSLNFVRLTS